MIDLTQRLRARGQKVGPIAADLYEELADVEVQAAARLWEDSQGQLVGFAYVSPWQNLVDVFDERVLTPELEAEIIAIGARLLICAALFQTADSVGIVYIGALRGAGDTVWPGVLATVLSWTVIVGLGWFLAARPPELESVGPWIAASLYIIALGIAMAVRFERGKWRDIKLVDRHV